MSTCKYALDYKNQEGYFTPTVPSTHPWHNKIVCIDWDAFCTDCMDKKEKELLGK